jgi:hypothetical protein
MEDQIYRKKRCELCGAVYYEKCISRGVCESTKWEYSGFGYVVICDHGFEHKDTDRIDVQICKHCKGKLFQAIRSSIDDIKSENKGG